MYEKTAVLKKWIEESHYIVFFGGAGVSTESGIPDFRSPDGLYSQKYGDLQPEEIISHSYFMSHPKEFFRFYRDKMIAKDAKPNRAHYALARLEEEGRLKAVITQNIDGLHQMAGSHAVYELHGSVLRNHCMKCGKSYGIDSVLNGGDIPRCPECGGIIKPDVVLYEEGLDQRTILNCVRHIENADLLIIGGTSLVVYPAAGLIDYFRRSEKHHLVLINKSSTERDSEADLVIHDSIGKVLGEAVGISENS